MEEQGKLGDPEGELTGEGSGGWGWERGRNEAVILRHQGLWGKSGS